MGKYSFTSLLCLAPLFILAQDMFVVYSVKGEVTIPGKRKTVLVNSGDQIPSSVPITISEGSGITLLGKDGVFFSASETGTHSLGRFSDSIDKSNSQLMHSFFKYLWNEAMIKSSAPPGKRRKNYFPDPESRTGPTNPVWIDRRSFDTTNYSGIGGDFGFYWFSFTNEKEHEFSLYATPDTDTPFYKVIVKNRRIPFADLPLQIKPGNRYYWTANRIGENESSLYLLNYVTKEVYDSVLMHIGKLKPVIEDPAAEAYRTAFMLEYSHYRAEAYQYYIKAVSLDPKNMLYRSTLTSFKKDYEIK